MEITSLVNLLLLAALGLLIIVSGGMIYLTTLEWRDRRRQDEDKRLRR